MSAFKITMKQEQIAQSFEIINAYSADASAGAMVAHHRALITRLNAEIVTLKQIASVQTFGAAVVVSTGCKGEWMVVAGGLDVTGAVVKGSRIGGISSKRNAEKLARTINKMA
ncbi:MAG: hypothetical protein ACRC8B_22895 [Aeromonas sobria]|uniref:hypothetical protein n=1 Tax=Aeromonas sobria TaxID=646 RepID=UPI003F3D5308